MMMSGAQILIETLIKHNVDVVFGYPGGNVLDIYDEFYKNENRIKHILTAGEQGAAHAADGFARVSGKTGVCIATSGPGASNLITGITNAYLDSVAVVFITGNTSLQNIGRDSFQEVDIIGITQPVIKHSFLVKKVTELEFIIHEAFYIANSGRKGPVLIDIPKNIQTESCEYIDLKIKEIVKKKPLFDLEEVAALIKNSKQPYIYCGGGAAASGSGAEILKLSETIKAPVGMSMMGISAIPSSYELNLGMSGMYGRRAATELMRKADLVIAAGVRFSDRAAGSRSLFSGNCKIIHIDIDEAELDKNVTADVAICGDAKYVLRQILKVIPKQRNMNWYEEIKKAIETEKVAQSEDFVPENIIKKINKYTKKETVIATDVGQHQMWTVQYYSFEYPHTLLTSGGLGVMGFGPGAAIGGCIANKKEQTYLFTGDGSFGMSLQELACMVSEELPVVIIIFNNNSLGMICQWQDIYFEKRYMASILDRKTDFTALAKAFGADGYRAENLAELEYILQNKLPQKRPCIIDCFINSEEKFLPVLGTGRIKTE